METTKVADKLIITLVKIWEKAPAELNEPGFGVDIWDLAVHAGILKKDEARSRRENFVSGAMDDLPSACMFMKDKGWITISDLGEYGRHSQALFPTRAGVEYVKGRRTKVVRLLNALGNTTKTVVIAVLTSVITTVLLYFILKWLGNTK